MNHIQHYDYLILKELSIEMLSLRFLFTFGIMASLKYQLGLSRDSIYYIMLDTFYDTPGLL